MQEQADKMVHSVFPLRWCMFFLVLQTRTVSSSSDKCPKVLKNFAAAVSNFTFCAVSNSRPLRFCCNCDEVYVQALSGHSDIIHQNCSNDLIFAEKYQIVEYAYDFVVDTWERTNCPDCFKNKKDGTPNEIKSEIKEFFHKLDAVEHCFYNYSQIHVVPVPTNHSKANASSLHSGLCNHCNKSYHALEESYKKIAGSDGQEYKVCADVAASMNYTRQRWSKDFHCVKIHTDLVSVVALTVFFCFLPIIFYTSVKLQGSTNDRKPGASSRASNN